MVKIITAFPFFNFRQRALRKQRKISICLFMAYNATLADRIANTYVGFRNRKLKENVWRIIFFN